MTSTGFLVTPACEIGGQRIPAHGASTCAIASTEGGCEGQSWRLRTTRLLSEQDLSDRTSQLVEAGGRGRATASAGGAAGYCPDAARRPVRRADRAGKVTAFFGQFGAIAEQEGIRKYVFKGFDGDVEPAFAPITAPTQFVDRVRAEAKAGKGSIDLLVGLHGDFVTFQNEGLIRGVGDVARQITTLPPALVKTGNSGRRPSTTCRTRRRRT